MMSFTVVMVVIGTWFVGVSTLAALWSRDPAGLAILVLPASIIAALLVVFFTWRATRRHDASSAANRLSRDQDSADDLDDVLAQSFPASDPPSSTSGIARVLPAPAG